MSEETRDKDIQELASELIEKLSVIANKQNGKNVTNANGDIILEDEPGKWIKMENKIFYQMIHTDVKKLKKENEILLTQYLDEMKPTLKSVDENVKELHKSVKLVKDDVDDLKRNRPKTLKSWLSEKGQLAESTSNIFKFIFYSLIILWILSTALPNIIKFISTIIGIEAGA